MEAPWSHPGVKLRLFAERNVHHKHTDDTRTEAREAVVLDVLDNLRLTVRYADTAEVEEGVYYDRIDITGYSPRRYRALSVHQHEHSAFVLGVAKLLERRVYMGREKLIVANHSFNDDLFVVTSGRTVLWGEKSVSPFTSFRVARANDTVGDDICMLVVDGKKRTRHYTARAATVTEVSAMNGAAFADLLATGRFDSFQKPIKAYGVWQILRNVLIKHTRARRTQDGDGTDPPDDASVVPSAATLRDDRATVALAADLAAKLAVGVLAKTPQDRDAVVAAAGGQAFVDAMAQLVQRLDGRPPPTPVPDRRPTDRPHVKSYQSSLIDALRAPPPDPPKRDEEYAISPPCAQYCSNF